MIGTFNEIDTQLAILHESMVNNVRDGVTDVNTLAGKIADLNQEIMDKEVRNVEASDLRDARDLLVDQVSALTNITTAEQDNGMVNVYINGVSLVNGNKAREMEAVGLGTALSPIKVQWKDMGTPVALTGGTLKSYVEESDMTGVDTDFTADNTTIPATTPYNWSTTKNASALATLRNGLSDLFVTLARGVNSIYSATGQNFFTTVSGTDMTLGNVQVNSIYQADYTQIKANSDGTTGNNDLSKKIGALKNDSTLFKCDGISMNLDTYYSSVISWMGTAGDTATANYKTQSGLLTQIQNQRSDLSAVSMDEEMSTMLTYQHAYSASARVMNVVDTLVAGLISDLGGR
jgi:flagellar hook-associated protein 1 FlgK